MPLLFNYSDILCACIIVILACGVLRIPYFSILLSITIFSTMILRLSIEARSDETMGLSFTIICCLVYLLGLRSVEVLK